MKILRVLPVLTTLIFTSCSSDDPTEATGLNKIRASAISEAAFTYGAQYALAWRASVISKNIEKQDKMLNEVYNFKGLVMDHNVLPPILQKSDNSMNLSNPNVIRLSDSVIEIIMPARFITTTPSWRNYINMSIYKYPEEPDNTVLPKTDEENLLWDKSVKKGWEEGKDQGDYIFMNSLSRLTRDYNGMSLYKKLYSQNMISAPFVSKANLGITGNSAKMRLNDQIVRITKPSELKTNFSKNWKPVLVSN
ncbi:MAG: type IV secretory system conjugative DNA transfer family protein [Legionellales bacterium]|nr:type IV secretory system conjugative DNA transfer family protein [Legionellales bacterium]